MSATESLRRSSRIKARVKENEEIPERTITEKICDQMREELVDIEENIQKPNCFLKMISVAKHCTSFKHLVRKML